jgi:hypothetical protein
MSHLALTPQPFRIFALDLCTPNGLTSEKGVLAYDGVDCSDSRGGHAFEPLARTSSSSSGPVGRQSITTSSVPVTASASCENSSCGIHD